MEAKSKIEENKCSTGDKKIVKAYCTKCKVYICTDCHVTKHIDHDSEVIDLAEKSTRFLAEYQKLSRMATLIADRRQVHIKEESIDSIVNDLKSRLVKVKENLQGDITKSMDTATNYLPTSPLLQEFIHKKQELSGKASEPLTKLKEELSKVCVDLLHQITQNKYETADKVLSQDLIKKYEEEIQKITEMTSGDMEYIHELGKLKQTQIEYSYDPLAILGMIKVESKAKKPDRVVQIDRERSLVNVYSIGSKKALTAKLETGFILPYRFVTIEAANNVYMIGGDNDHGYYLKSTYLYDEIRGVLVAKACMIDARSRHAAVACGDHIYAIAGENQQGVLDSCEKYDIKENTWKAMPKLNNKRCGLSACINGNYIYAGFGWDNEYLNSIERYDIEKCPKSWEMVKLAKKQVLHELQAPGMISLKENEILVFGGYKEGEELTAEAAILETKGNIVKKVKPMKEAESFISSEIKKAGEMVYAFGYAKGGIHTYDVGKDEWEFVPQDKIPM